MAFNQCLNVVGMMKAIECYEATMKHYKQYEIYVRVDKGTFL